MTSLGIKQILVATDMSDASDRALRYARVFAETFESNITMFYADPILYATMQFGAELPVDYPPLLESEAALDEQLNTQGREHFGSAIEFTTRIVAGSPIPTIIRIATETQADLIIVGTHGHRGLRHFAIGSIAAGVVHAAERPVLTVRSGADDVVPVIRRVLCPVNETEIARDALRAAAGLARKFAAELVTVHVIEDERSMANATRQIHQWLKLDEMDVSRHRELILRGNAAERLLDCLDDLDVSLLVLGGQHRLLRDETVIGTTTERLIRFARCPVYTVIHAPRRQGTHREHEATVAV